MTSLLLLLTLLFLPQKSHAALHLPFTNELKTIQGYFDEMKEVENKIAAAGEDIKKNH